MPEPDGPIINGRNACNALIIASVATILLATNLYAARYPIPCALIALFVGTAATVLRLPLPSFAGTVSPIVRTDNIEQVTVERPAVPSAPTEAAAPVKRSHHAKAPLHVSSDA